MFSLKYIENFKKNDTFDREKLTEYFKIKEKDDFFLLKYKKEKLNEENIKTLGLFRSVIFNKNEIVCVAPPKSIPYNKEKNYEIYEFIEGTMINSWYDTDKESWRIATKSIIDAKCCFYEYQKKTFSNLFYEACKYCNFNLDILDKNVCYSFVLQHPTNRIINNILEPRLFLVSAYKKLNNYDFECIPYTKLEYLTHSSKLKLPCKYNDIVERVEKKLNSYETPIYNMGVILREDGNVFHSKIRNKSYEEIKKLKTNNTKLIYTYLSLFKSNLVEKYLFIFPEHAENFNAYLNRIVYVSNLLLSLYEDVFVKKYTKLEELDDVYINHLKRIHKNYLKNLKEFKLQTNYNDVFQYFINVPPYILVQTLELTSSLN